MSDVEQTVSYIDQLKQQHAGFIAQRDQTQANLNQLIGAIFACDLMIKKYEDELKKDDAIVKPENHSEEIPQA